MPSGFGDTGPINKEKVGFVMSEFKKGKLHSGPGKKHKAKNFKQAIAIALSEGRKAAR
jgi:hypothetical protein